MNFKVLLADIRFWILLFFVARLFSINQPCIDSYAWRQADGYSIARNFLEEDSNILYPRIDNRADKSGITGSEFPILNYLAYQSYKFTDMNWWQGRLINLIISSLGIFFFFKLLNKHLFKELAFSAAMILLVSIWFSFSRKFTADTFSCSLILMGVYWTYEYFQRRNWWFYVLALVFISLGLLSKLPAFVILVFIAPLASELLRSKKKLGLLLLLGIVSFIPGVWWYFKWVPHLNDSFGISYFFMGKTLSESVTSLWLEKAVFFKRFYQSSFFYVAFVFWLVGIFYVFRKSGSSLRTLFWAGLAAGLVFIIKSGTNFTEHTYYVIPLVPLMAVISAQGIQSAAKNARLKFIILGLLCTECVANQISVWVVKANEKHFLELNDLAERYIPKEELVLTNGCFNPLSLYHADRKGSSLCSTHFDNPEFIKAHFSYSNYIIWDKKEKMPKVLKDFQVLIETDKWKFIKQK